MRKTYILENLGCAACASEIERKISALPGVARCSVNFFTTKLCLEAEEAAFGDIEKKAAHIVGRIEPGTVMRS